MTYEEKKFELETLIHNLDERIDEIVRKPVLRYSRRADTRYLLGLKEEKRRLESELEGVEYAWGQML